MAEFVKLTITPIPRLYAVGKALRADMNATMGPDNPLPAFWGQCMQDKTLDTVQAQYKDQLYSNDQIGLMYDWQGGDGLFTYMIGMLLTEKPTTLPEGYETFTLSPIDVAIGWVRGKNGPDLFQPAHKMTEEALAQAGYIADDIPWSLELYNCPRFTTPDADGNVILDYWLPCRRA